VERLPGGMREESAGSETESRFFRHAAERHPGMSCMASVEGAGLFACFGVEAPAFTAGVSNVSSSGFAL
jgi:hypothetical protein